jgi:hypothetical protein
MRKLLLVLSAFAVLLVVSTEALALSPIIYNAVGNQIGVISRLNPDGSAIVQPSAKTLGLGQYKVTIAAENLRPRDKGGWQTDLTNDQMAYLPPISARRFWMPSGA